MEGGAHQENGVYLYNTFTEHVAGSGVPGIERKARDRVSLGV